MDTAPPPPDLGCRVHGLAVAATILAGTEGEAHATRKGKLVELCIEGIPTAWRHAYFEYAICGYFRRGLEEVSGDAVQMRAVAGFVAGDTRVVYEYTLAHYRRRIHMKDTVIVSSFGWVAVALLVAACGGNTSKGFSAGGSGGAGGSGAASPTACPAKPSPGQACSTPDLQCTYGDSVRPECRDDWLCFHGRWTTTMLVCPMPPPGTCSSSPPANGVVCKTGAAVCSYADGTLCMCSMCSAAGPCALPPRWRCAPPPTAAGCPPTVPNDGTACSAPAGTKCQYGNPCGPSGAIVSCTSGVWRWQQQIPCPA